MPSVGIVASVMEKIHSEVSRHMDRNWSFASAEEEQMVKAISIILRMYEEKIIYANVRNNARDWSEDNCRVFAISAEIANEIADLTEEQQDKETTVETRKMKSKTKIKTLQKSFYRIFPIICLNMILNYQLQAFLKTNQKIEIILNILKEHELKETLFKLSFNLANKHLEFFEFFYHLHFNINKEILRNSIFYQKRYLNFSPSEKSDSD